MARHVAEGEPSRGLLRRGVHGQKIAAHLAVTGRAPERADASQAA
jgi:hypothetical protein